MKSPEISPYLQMRLRPLPEVMALRARDDFRSGLKYDQCPFTTSRNRKLWQQAWLKLAGALSQTEETDDV